VVIPLLNDDIVLDCYRLASYYHLDPRIFLDIPISEVFLHLRRTAEVERARNPDPDDQI
jgi:hypothetical protein